MPVKFKGSSEYASNFPWRESHRSQAVQDEFKSSAAGKPSFANGPSGDKMFLQKRKLHKSADNLHTIIEEPNMDRKKKTDIAELLRQSAPANENDYLLLGGQQKFASNVAYKPRTGIATLHPAILAKKRKQDRVAKSKEKEKSPQKPHKPAPVVVVETGALDIPQGEQNNNIKHQNKKLKEKHSDKRKEHVSEQKTDKKTVKEPKEAKVNGEFAQKDTKKQQPQAVGKTDMREKRKGKMNEFVQTDMKNKQTDSGAQAPDDYALKYRAGVPPPRPNGPKRVTEYQMQFKWRDRVGAVPMLAAEQVVHTSNTNLAPSRSASSQAVTKSSEYQKSFQNWRDSRGMQRDTARSRSKSVDSVRPSDMAAAGSERVVSSDNKRLKDSLNPQQYKTEYYSNYRAPKNFGYSEGAWRGAAPPHTNYVEGAAEDDRAPAQTWYDEVRELRKKAEEYRLRAMGTHFGRTHLAQLYARQAELWDTVSNSDSLDALSLERSSDVTSHRSDSKASSRTVSQTSTRVSSRVSTPRPSPHNKRNKQDQPAPRRVERVKEQAAQTELEHADDGDDASTIVGSERGRVPTPRLKSSASSHTPSRHHLDRTTPAVGGALLTAPTHDIEEDDIEEIPARDETSVGRYRKTAAPPPKIAFDSPPKQGIENKKIKPPEGAECETDKVFDSKSPLIDTEDAPQTPCIDAERLLEELRLKHKRKLAQLKNEARREFEQSQAEKTKAVTMKDNYTVMKKNSDTQTDCNRDDAVGTRGTVLETVRMRQVNKHQNEHSSQVQPLLQVSEPDSAVAADELQRTKVRERSPARKAPVHKDATPMGEGRAPAQVYQPQSAGVESADAAYRLSGPRPGAARRGAPPQATSMTMGMPTRDSHVLMDERANNDAPLATRYVHGPLKEADVARHNDDVTLPLDQLSRDGDDVLSQSARSLVSSGSLASEVLERARVRRDKFW